MLWIICRKVRAFLKEGFATNSIREYLGYAVVIDCQFGGDLNGEFSLNFNLYALWDPISGCCPIAFLEGHLEMISDKLGILSESTKLRKSFPIFLFYRNNLDKGNVSCSKLLNGK